MYELVTGLDPVMGAAETEKLKAIVQGEDPDRFRAPVRIVDDAELPLAQLQVTGPEEALPHKAASNIVVYSE